MIHASVQNCIEQLTSHPNATLPNQLFQSQPKRGARNLKITQNSKADGKSPGQGCEITISPQADCFAGNGERTNIDSSKSPQFIVQKHPYHHFLSSECSKIALLHAKVVNSEWGTRRRARE
jgi:hypothetical protein